VQVRFWGTRGSIATPGRSTLRFGGNTSCVELRTQAGTLIVFDCGTGARGLGLSLLQRGGPVTGAMLLGHTHWDHIQGFPFFGPAFVPGNHFTIFAPTGGDKQLLDVLAGQMQYTYFPVRLDQLQAQIDFHDLGEDTFTIGDATVQAQYLNHTALTLGYRVTAGGVTVVYATDHEPNDSSRWLSKSHGGPGHLLHPGDQRHIRFLAGADLVIHDAQYTAAEYVDRVGWGHSPMEYVVDAAAEAGAKRLALFHHDPAHTDSELDRLVARCQHRAETRSGDLAVFGAREEHVIGLPERQGSRMPDLATVAPGLTEPWLSERARILMVDDESTVLELLVATLADDDYELQTATDGPAALELAREWRPDLVLLDLGLPGLDGLTVCRQIRNEPGLAEVPVIILSGNSSENAVADGFAEGATDYMTKPFAPAMLRTRVRSWLLRRGVGPS
jgi:CheY-like chemotaxis protein/phosphoribosyl 1,2-cyclic phosphodiesterase